MNKRVTYVFSNCVEAQSFEHLQIIYHGFPVWRHIQPIGPKSLVERAEHECELSI